MDVIFVVPTMTLNYKNIQSKMKTPIYGLILVSLVFNACSNVLKSSEITTDITTNDSIKRQQLIDSLLSTVAWKNPQAHISYFLLNGHIGSIEYTTDSDVFIPPFETVFFDEEGMLVSVLNSYQIPYNCIIEDDKQSKILRVGVEDVGLAMEFNMVREDQKSIFEEYDETGSIKYTFNGNSNKLEVLCTYYPDMSSDECEKSSETYNVEVGSRDSHNNWTSLTLHRKDDSITITRKIKYIEDPSCIKFYESKSGDKVLFKFASEDNNFFLKIYDCSSGLWNSVIPPGYDSNCCGYKDFRLIDNELYLIFNTGNNWIGEEYGIYLYDINDDTWTELAMGGEGSGFVGDKIKVSNYTIVEYGDCTANNRYVENINWIELKKE